MLGPAEPGAALVRPGTGARLAAKSAADVLGLLYRCLPRKLLCPCFCQVDRWGSVKNVGLRASGRLECGDAEIRCDLRDKEFGYER